MTELQVILIALLPRRAPWIPHLLADLAAARGLIASADACAHHAGFGNRHQLYRALKEAEYPPLTELAEWIRLLDWTLNAAAGQRISAQALEEGHDPAVRYRLVRKLTGRPWSEVRRLGPGWVMLQLLKRCGISVGDEAARGGGQARNGGDRVAVW